ncbi:RNA degradosome polyphosphate kinase, partial [bacterium]|nr:RNA degradosome polyphosphate kinase [bacterium]
MEPRYSNRELSLLDFQERVLAIAENPSVPLLERVKFVAIVSSNLDEFFQVRVAGIAEQEATGVTKQTADGMTPSEQLIAIRARVEVLVSRVEKVFTTILRPALEAEGIRLAAWDDLDEGQRNELHEVFDQQIYPILTPLAFDPQHPFPFISNLSLNLAVQVRDPGDGSVHFARVKMPSMLPRFLRLSDDTTFVPIDAVAGEFIDRLFPGMEIIGAYPFRITRSADQAVEEEEAEDLLHAM